ncbi:glutathione transferase GST 23 [Citrus sinensis]|uniref:Glutathione transferase GST 23 n=1 Tax=Citrus sinensis TaxID=2711 RepID=A0ACB8I2X9_CITSI|nr:glutathione transferase GST 23 [Citrus sinensis]
MAEVKLHGAWASAFCYRVIWALKLKGIAYDYIEEDLSNKSALLLKYNPVHKKVPVLVHDKKSVCESIVILEYIEEMWPHNPSLMPRRKELIYQNSIGVLLFISPGATVWKKFCSVQDQESTMKEILEMLKTVEEHGLGEKKFFHGDIGLVDIAFASIVYWLQIIEDVARFENFKRVREIEENLPNRDELLGFFKRSREKLVASSSLH